MSNNDKARTVEVTIKMNSSEGYHFTDEGIKHLEIVMQAALNFIQVKDDEKELDHDINT
jgi:hypothetical protein